jgi:hypothetical protein
MKSAIDENPHFELSASVREILSWRLMAELVRRHPNAGTLIETHPGGGQYDCLTLYREGKSIASLNRGGDFTPFFNLEEQISSDQIWLPCLKDQGFARVLNKMSKALGLEVPEQLPATTPEVLVYRVIAGLLASSLLDKEPLECRNGQMDSSGSEDQVHREAWFEAFATALDGRRQLDRSASLFGNPNYHFWFILRRDAPVLGFSTDGNAHTKEGLMIDLMKIYKRRRKLEDVIGALISQCV